ncbi:hypothetical protein [Saccharopolyspora sp. NPDC002376]
MRLITAGVVTLATLPAMTSVDVHMDWGLPGLRAMFGFPVLVVVDVLSFSTSAEVATANGARVLPLRSHDTAVPEGTVLAGPRSRDRWSLSLSSLRTIADVKLGLPSPNSETLCAEASATGATVFTGCLRNADAVAAAVNSSRTAPVLRDGFLEAA